MGRRGRAVVGGGMLALFVFALGVFLLPFAFPTPPPIVTRFSGSRLISPNGDGHREVARISVRMRVPGTITLLEVVSSDGTTVRTLETDTPVRRGWFRASWGGRTDAGEDAPDGIYSLRLRAKAGEKVFRTSRRIVIDRTGPALAVAEAASAGLADLSAPAQCLVTAVPDGDAQITFAALTADGAGILRASGPRPVRDGRTARWSWDGTRRDGGAITPGLVTLEIRAADAARNATSVRRTCWIGNAVGRVTRPGRPGTDVRVRLRTAAGAAYPARTRVTLRLYRRAGTPGGGLRVLGPRVARAVRTTAGDAVLRLPPGIPASALWLVADVRGGRALIAPEGPR
ncbi:MAG: hypothetical protein IT200_01365 [Thermoleophilia bacterium]|nr:hypothetical protein [Thermoleophilia bacterium]